MEKTLQNMKSRLETFNDLQYSHITDGFTSKKTRNKKERIKEIETGNLNLLDKLQSIFTHQALDDRPMKLKSLNYNRRKREVSRINEENKRVYKSLQGVKSTYKRENYET